MKRQRGVTVSGLLVWGVILVLGAVLTMKVLPTVIEYYTIIKVLKAMTSSGELNGATVGDVRRSFERRSVVDDITSVTPQDLQISKDGNQIVVEFQYEKKIPLFANVSLAINYTGSSAASGKSD